MPIVEINFVAVLVAAIVSMALGAFWYSPAGFGKQWVAEMGWSKKEAEKKMKEGGGKSYLVNFIAALITMYVLAMLVDWAQAATLVEGVIVGFWAWLGFIATIMVGSIIWEGKSTRYFTINAAYHLVNLGIAGAILAAW